MVLRAGGLLGYMRCRVSVVGVRDYFAVCWTLSQGLGLALGFGSVQDHPTPKHYALNPKTLNLIPKALPKP